MVIGEKPLNPLFLHFVLVDPIIDVLMHTSLSHSDMEWTHVAFLYSPCLGLVWLVHHIVVLKTRKARKHWQYRVDLAECLWPVVRNALTVERHAHSAIQCRELHSYVKFVCVSMFTICCCCPYECLMQSMSRSTSLFVTAHAKWWFPVSVFGTLCGRLTNSVNLCKMSPAE